MDTRWANGVDLTPASSLTEIADEKYNACRFQRRTPRLARTMHVCISAVTMLFLRPAYAVGEDMVTLPTVVIVSSPSFRNIYAEGSVPALDAVIASAWYGTRALTWEYYFEYKEFVAFAR